jgi:hypothetical protein
VPRCSRKMRSNKRNNRNGIMSKQQQTTRQVRLVFFPSVRRMQVPMTVGYEGTTITCSLSFSLVERILCREL